MNQTRGTRTNNYYSSEYINGNTVRVARPERETRVDERRQVRERKVSRTNKGLTMNVAHVAFLSVVSLVCFIMCVTYLTFQNQVTNAKDNISDLKKQIKTVQYQNDAISYSINSYVNVDNIYKKATTKLGMRQASDSQISYYKSSESGYTLQYGDIPSK